MVHAIHLVMPRTAMPMIIPGEVQNPRPFDVERDIFVLRQLIKKVAGIGPFIAAAPVVSAAHVSARADALVRPSFPETVCIQTNGDKWRLVRPNYWTEQDQ